VYAYKNKSTYDYLNFIFSSNSFNDALKRIGYLKSYRSYRQQQVANIVQTQEQIEDHKQQLLGKKTQKNSALQNQSKQLQALEDQKKEKDAVVAKLQSQEKDLQKQITARKKRDLQLKKSIAAVVRREIEIARKAAEAEAKRKRDAEEAANANTTGSVAAKPTKKATTTARPKSFLDLNEKDVALNSNFEKNRGRLPWPVDNGFVSIPYGTSRVGGLSMDNPGITVSTPSSGANVKAVFDGEVSSVSNLGDGMMVMIRHGKYFSVYSNLSSVGVSKGSQIKTGQSIGRAGSDDDGSGGQIDFLLMIESRNVNPQPWLR
jgi:septal ring factor EnvC (AmiA/AmiB activator)